MGGRLGCCVTGSLRTMRASWIYSHECEGEHSPGAGGQRVPRGSRAAVMRVLPCLSVRKSFKDLVRQRMRARGTDK